MSRVCAVSGKKALSGNKRSHSLHASRRKWNVNLQKVKVMVDGKPQRIRISARALKTWAPSFRYVLINLYKKREAG